jgi:polyisoprenyl-teichoic acid--peptidoglycan teichoic acid transferase
MSMDPPPSERAGGRRPYPVPPRPDPGPAAPGKIHARDLIDQLPEPDPSLLREPETGRRSRRRRARGGRHGTTAAVRSRRSWPQRILLSVLVLAALVSGTAAALAGYLTHKLDQITYVEIELSTAPPPGEPRNLLIVGSDSRDSLAESADPTIDTSAFVGDGSVGSGQRSDTIIVVRVDPAATAVDVLSIPRDLWLPIADTGGSQRINTAYAGGPQRLVDTIEEQFDIPIHHYVEVDFVGFADLVAAVGGVPMWFDTPVRDTHSGLQVDSAGCHRLDAQSALAYARSRHLQYQDDDGRWRTDGTGDLGRITRQQVFLRRAVDQLSTLGVSDALTLNRLLDVGIDNVTLSRGLGLSQLRELAQRFSSFDSDAMRTYAVPTYSFRTSGGAAVEGLLEPEAQPIFNIFRGLPPDTLTPVQVDQVTVLNGTGVEGHAALVADALEEVGFGIVATGNTDDPDGADAEAPLVRTTIRHAPDALHAADLLERHLTSGAELVVDRTLAEGELVLEIGTDLTTVGRNARPSELPPPTTSTPDPADGEDGTIDGSGTDTEAPAPIGVAPDPSVRCG